VTEKGLTAARFGPPSSRSRVRRADKALVVASAVCLALVVLAMIGPWLAPYSPSAITPNANQGFSSQHLLGTDTLGRDILSRLLVATRLSLLGPALVVLTSTTLGTALAIASAWFGGWFDRIVSRVVAVLFAFPSMLFAVLAVAVFGQGLIAPVIALSIAYIPYFARIGRTVALRERYLPYIEACKLSGFSGWRICLWHILPNMASIVRAQATIGFGSALVDIAAISFLGLGVQPPSAEWGLMVSSGRSALLAGSPQESLSAGVMIIIAVVAFNVLGERMAKRSEER